MAARAMIVSVTAGLIVGGCSEVESPPGTLPASEERSTVVSDSASAIETVVQQTSGPRVEITQAIDALAASFRDKTRAVREEFYLAPFFCVMPPTPTKQHAFEDEWGTSRTEEGVPFPARDLVGVSEAWSETPHGRKIYKLRATDVRAYLELVTDTRTTIPEGFAVIKETWRPEGSEETLGLAERGEHAGLFVMSYHGLDEPDTDHGWVYSTFTPGSLGMDGQQTLWTRTAIGRIESCLGCHEDAPHGRLFGLDEVTEAGYQIGSSPVVLDIDETAAPSVILPR